MPNGPLSQYEPSGAKKLTGSPSVRCGSTIVSGEKRRLPGTKLPFGVPASAAVGPVTGSPGSGTVGVPLVVANTPVYVYGAMFAAALPAAHTFTVHVPAAIEDDE